MTALHIAGPKNDDSVPLKRYILLFANNFIKLSVQLAVIFLYARSLPIMDYGIYQTVWLYVNILSVVALFGLPNLILTYGLGDLIYWLRTNKRFTIIYFLTIIVALALFFTHKGVFTWQIKLLLVLYLLFQNLSIIAETFSIKVGSDTRVVIVNMFFAVLFLMSHVVLLNIGYSLPLLLICLLVLQMLKSAFLFRSIPRSLKVQTFSDVGKQWFYLGLVDVLGVLYKWLDKWIILFFISVSQFAIYFNGAYEIPIFAMMVSAVGNVMLVELAKQGVPDKDKIISIFTNTSLMLAAIVFPAFSFLFFYHDMFFLLFFGEKYSSAIPIFLISIFVIPLRITNFTALLQSNHRNDLVLRGVMIDLASAILLMIVFYPWLGIRGFALAFVLSTYCQAIFYLFKTAAVTGLRISDFFPFQKLFVLLIVSLVVTGALYAIFRAYFLHYIFPAGVMAFLLLVLTLLKISRVKGLPIV